MFALQEKLPGWSFALEICGPARGDPCEHAMLCGRNSWSLFLIKIIYFQNTKPVCIYSP